MTVYIVGLDGATFDLIDRWEDDLPNLAELKEEGAYGELETVTPPITPAAWTSFMTGKNPGKHGIYDFSVKVRGEDNRFELVSSGDIGTYTLYEYLNDQGLTTGSFNIPLTYPPLDIDGYILSGGPVAEFGPHACRPEELWQELEALGGVRKETVTYTGDNPGAFVDSQHEQLADFERAFLHLMEERDEDLHAVLFQNTDNLAHWMWKYHDEDHPDHPAGNDHQDAIRDIYRRADEAVGKIRERMDEDDHLIIMSDHGFGGVHKSIYVNNLFHREGLLQFRRTPGTLLRRLLFRLGIDMELANRVGTRLGLKHRARKSQKKNDGDGGLLIRLVKSLLLSADDIDWDRTKAYSRGNFGQVFLNEDLSGEERERVKDRVREALYGLEDPDTGKQVITDVLDREELYHGPETDRAADLVFMTRDMEYMPARHFEFGSRQVLSDAPVRNGHHRMNGIFYIAGPGIDGGTELDGLHITDVAPTAIH
ncbi:MAG: alkaline phosphatase family protein, partial [Candidatus Nanohaloarchaea archaeon]|nr:alkaline phosphatase family protein [Candidatus Nanohaloarchaea archaeon]